MVILDSLKEAQAAGLHQACQDAALNIAGFIEQAEGEGTATVELLLDYYTMLQNASADRVSDRALRKRLNEVESSIKYEVNTDTIEVVFLSYKASMSDSIESIYLAAKADPNCKAYWIPVPYYDRKPDGSLGRMHYEGAEYYDDAIECTDWREYNIEENHPDIIFHFNLYDTDNLMTSVHSDFYSQRLRFLTDQLVLVPYFVVADDVPEHFCATAGCYYAHKVVVQSEKVRETYVRVFAREIGGKAGDPEEKFVALGSPKFDRIFSTTREDYTLPDQWRERIGGRKVILYNTTINALLHGNEQYLAKLRHVLGVFKSRDDVALLWRPHPLNEAAYGAQRPDLLDAYEEIVAEYRREGWGIYDDTADLHRAIAWSDAYYGDQSSLVVMYQATGKPVMVQNIGVTPDVKPNADAAAVVGAEADAAAVVGAEAEAAAVAVVAVNADADEGDNEDAKQDAHTVIDAEAAKKIATAQQDLFDKKPEDLRSQRDCIYFENASRRLSRYARYIAAQIEDTDNQEVQERRIAIIREANIVMDGTAGSAIYRAIVGHAV
ncbi:MAG: hypothetical protein FWF83_00900 [Clostridiales bacterium]|nr:hypothetical protein [Clostridiales bacterium]